MADSKISALAALTGANVTLSTDVLAIVDTSAGATKKILADELGIALNLYKVSSFAKDLSQATSTVAYTGVGFQPKAIVFVGGNAASNSNYTSAGIDDGTTAGCISNLNATGAGTWGAPAASIYFNAGGTDTQSAVIATFDVDGFTLNWTKSGSPSGAMTVYYLALR